MGWFGEKCKVQKGDGIQLLRVFSKGQHSLAKPCSCFHSYHVPFVLAAAGAVAEPPLVLSLFGERIREYDKCKGPKHL